MKQKFYQNRIETPLYIIGILLLACISMWGCTDVDFHWSNNRSKAKIIGFVDDSLVMVGDYRYWSEITDEWNGGYSEIEGFGHERLCVYNYRVQEDGPRWCDSLDNETETGAFMGQMTDSVIWGSGLPNLLKLWKIGEKQHEIKLAKEKVGCSVEFKVSSVKQWLDGGFIVRGGNSLNAGNDSCQYAVMDTTAETLTYKRLNDDLKWIQECDDVRAWGNDVYCLKFDKEERTSSLFVNDSLGHVLENDYFWTAGAVLQFQGHILLLERDVCRLENGKIKCFASASSSGISFKNREDDVYITY